MRTQIVDRVVYAAAIEDCDQLLTNRKGPPLPFRDRSNFGNGDEIRHFAHAHEKYETYDDLKIQNVSGKR